MPTLISETDVRLEKSDLLRRVVLPRAVSADGFLIPPARTPGLHLSGLLKYFAKKLKHSEYAAQADEDNVPLQWLLGHAWEEMAVSLYPDTIWQPGELMEPVIMNCDGLTDDAEVGAPVVEEFKFRRAKRMSGVDFVTKRWAFMQQGLGYCLGYGAEHVRWHVCAVMEWPDMIYTKYLVKFSEKEIADMARMIEVNKKGAMESGYCE